jgi:cytochrome b
MSEPNSLQQTVPVWDLPTRLFHWTLVALMIVQWLTAESDGAMKFHVWGGYTARFSHFVRGPGTALGYVKALLRGETPLYVGHNPMGGWSILALLTLLLIQAGTGLFANDDITFDGPLSSWVSKSMSNWLTTVHKVNFNLLLVVIAVHVSAVLFYLLVKRENLIHPMLSGRKHLSPELVGSAPRLVSPWLGLAALAVAVVAVGLLVR